MDGKERRRWKRHRLHGTAKIKIREQILFSKVRDVSGGGAAFEGVPAFNVGEALQIDLDKLRSVPGALVREWDDGYSVAFDLDDDDRHSLQEDMDSFMRENDLRKD